MNYRKTIAMCVLGACCLLSCGKQQAAAADTAAADHTPEAEAPPFSADSAYAHISRQLEFGPRIPGSEAHRACGDWLEAKLKSYGTQVITQQATLTAFDGTRLPMRNIMARINPDAPDRTLLLAHWDTRPWADNDPDPANHTKPVPGANDGASGVAVLLEVARQLQLAGTDKGIDILLVDVEDYGSEGDDESWALGTRYFAEHPPVAGYTPTRTVLLDMVGGEGALFPREAFSQQYSPALLDEVWRSARSVGHGSLFVNDIGAAITDDHVELIKAGWPAIDVIGLSPGGSFLPTWHTVDDNLEHISTSTLQAVGSTIMQWLNP